MRRSARESSWLLTLACLAGHGCNKAQPSEPPAASGGPANVGRSDPPPSAPGWFVESSAEWGLDFAHDAGATDERHLPETMGGGACVADWNGDGLLDIYFVQSGPIPIERDAPRSSAPPNQLFLGSGPGRFEDRTAGSGAAAHRGYGMGVTTGDLNGDGALDIFVTNFGPDVLVLGDGRGSFADATEASGVADDRWTAAPVLFDADSDGDLDLYVTAYVQIDVHDPAWCGRTEPGWRSYCHPDHYQGLQDRFWLNDGTGHFVDATEAAGFSDSYGKGLGALPEDFDGDGDIDLYVANDSVENRLWRNRGDGTFEDDTLLSGAGVNGSGATEAGMGLAAGDIDTDGDLDFVVTNFDDESNTLYENRGLSFADSTAARGLEAKSRLPVAFGVAANDFDADGDLDLAVANGHILHNIELYHDGKRWAQEAHLFVNESGRFRYGFEEAGALDDRPYVGRGLFVGDLDSDGDLDLLLTQCDGPARLFENRGATHARVLRGVPRGARVELLGASRSLLRVPGYAPSYFGQGAADITLPQDIERIRVSLLGGESRTFELDPKARPIVTWDALSKEHNE